MRFNAFLWQNFLESSTARKWLDLFDGLRKRYDNEDANLREFVEQWICSGMLEENVSFNDHVADVIENINILELVLKENLLPGGEIKTWEQAEDFFNALADLHYSQNEEKNPNSTEVEYIFEHFHVPSLSVALYFIYPEFFFPYYFYPQFYRLRQIFDDFGLFLPPVPPKRDHDARFAYYLELCQSMHRFCDLHGISGRHLPVFLYGFAPNFIENTVTAALPPPRRAWFVGGGINNNGDFEVLDGVSPESTAIWQGNPDTQPGDIIVMYCLTPRSYIHSIWTALRPGAVEPFRFFYNTIWIGHPKRVVPIHLSEIKSDPLLSQMPLVKGNMQGINGRQIKKEFYDQIKHILSQKGMDVSILPQLEDVELGDIEFKNEKDVERYLLEPLLAKLDFEEADWTRQMHLKVGRSEKVIPDYVVIPSFREQSGDWVWEAKLSIQSHRQLTRDFDQVRSYAKLLRTKGLSLISKEGLWISLERDDYRLDKARHWSMSQVKKSDCMNEIRDLASKGKIAAIRPRSAVHA